MPYAGSIIQDIPNNLPHVADAVRMETNPDMYGGDVTTTVAVTTNLRCFVQTASHKEIDVFAKRGYEISHKVYMSAASAAFLAEDIILVNLRPLANFPASMRLKVRTLADATVNLSPDLTKVFALGEFGGVNP